MVAASSTVPRAFVLRRLHSLMGLWLVIYLIMHLFTNSQAALFIGDDGGGFIRAVNAIHELPYLPFIEIAILGIPIIIHTLWGIKYAWTAQINSLDNKQSLPYLPEYPRNHAYTWQRITAWLLIFGIVAHIIHMRFIEYPSSVKLGGQHAYMVRVSLDEGIYTLADRLNVSLYDEKQIQLLQADPAFPPFFKTSTEILPGEDTKAYILLEEQHLSDRRSWLETLKKNPPGERDAIAVADNFGTVELLMLRDTFKNPVMLALYTLLVLTTCFHAFNGLWTFMIKWGVTLTQRSQQLMWGISTILMATVACLGLSSIWLTYWINLKQ